MIMITIYLQLTIFNTIKFCYHLSPKTSEQNYNQHSRIINSGTKFTLQTAANLLVARSIK